VILLGSDSLGRGEEDLGRLLMHKFLHELAEADPLPEMALFINSGVKLVGSDSHVVGQLHKLETKGVELLACSTCLERFGLLNRLTVGEKSNMGEIVAALSKATKVISI